MNHAMPTTAATRRTTPMKSDANVHGSAIRIADRYIIHGTIPADGPRTPVGDDSVGEE